MLTKPEACSVCPSAAINQGYAPGEGPEPAPIMFVGEALGETEANEGRPFRGGTGKMLRMMLHQAGLRPHEYYITNVVKCRPPANRTPTANEITICTSLYLEKEIERVRPKVLCPVGDTAMRYFLGNAVGGIQTSRGYVFDSVHGYTVIPIVHPSFVARGNREYWAITVYDLKKIKLASQGLLPKPQPNRFNIYPTIDDVRAVCKMILNKQLRIAFDLETLGELQKINILCCGVAWSNNDAICVPFLKRGGVPYWDNTDHEAEAWYWLNELWESDCMKVGQNIFTFDIPVLMQFGVQFKRHTCRDTLIRHHCIGLELPHSLSFLTSVYTRLPHYKLDVKSAGGFMWAPDETVRKYNCLDCIATYQVDTLLTKEMIDFGILEDSQIG